MSLSALEKRVAALESRKGRSRMDYAGKIEEFERAFELLHVLVPNPAEDPGGLPELPAGFEPPTRDWTPAKLGPDQYSYLHSTARRNVVDAARRSFKSQGLVRRTVRAAITTTIPNAEGYLCGPTHAQSKRRLWKPLKRMIPAWALKGGREAFSESEMTVTLFNGATITVAGLDVPERIEGGNWDFGGITEFGNTRPGLIGEHIEAMLTNESCWIDMEGTPELSAVDYRRMVDQIAAGDVPGGARFTWSTEDVLHLWKGRDWAEKKLATWRSALSPRLYRQEILGEWVNPSERAYAEFDATDHVASGLRYDPALPLIVALDFNVKPGIAAILQEQPNRGRFPRAEEDITAVVDEVWIADDSTTRKVCHEILARYREHKGPVYIYGDPAGGARKTSADSGSDWDIVRGLLRPVFGQNLRDRVAGSAPSIRGSVVAVEKRMRSYDGKVRFLVSSSCSHTRTDYEGTTWTMLESPEGKRRAGDLTHLSDAIRYYVAERWPVVNAQGRATAIRV